MGWPSSPPRHPSASPIWHLLTVLFLVRVSQVLLWFSKLEFWKSISGFSPLVSHTALLNEIPIVVFYQISRLLFHFNMSILQLFRLIGELLIMSPLFASPITVLTPRHVAAKAQWCVCTQKLWITSPCLERINTRFLDKDSESCVIWPNSTFLFCSFSHYAPFNKHGVEKCIPFPAHQPHGPLCAQGPLFPCPPFRPSKVQHKAFTSLSIFTTRNNLSQVWTAVGLCFPPFQ